MTGTVELSNGSLYVSSIIFVTLLCYKVFYCVYFSDVAEVSVSAFFLVSVLVSVSASESRYFFSKISIIKQNNEDNANFYHFSCFCCREAKIFLFDESDI